MLLGFLEVVAKQDFVNFKQVQTWIFFLKAVYGYGIRHKFYIIPKVPMMPELELITTIS